MLGARQYLPVIRLGNGLTIPTRTVDETVSRRPESVAPSRPRISFVPLCFEEAHAFAEPRNVNRPERGRDQRTIRKYRKDEIKNARIDR